jgi:hypothetical protein
MNKLLRHSAEILIYLTYVLISWGIWRDLSFVEGKLDTFLFFCLLAGMLFWGMVVHFLAEGLTNKLPNVRSFLSSPIIAWCVVVVTSCAAIITFVLLLGDRISNSNEWTLEGSFVPNGRVKLLVDIPVPSIEDICEGKVDFQWKVPTTGEYFSSMQIFHQGSFPKHKAIQRPFTNVACGTRVPNVASVVGRTLELTCTVSGSTTVLSETDQYSEIGGHGPKGGVIIVDTHEHPFKISLSPISVTLQQPTDFLYPLLCFRQEPLKIFAWWIVYTVLQFITSGVYWSEHRATKGTPLEC